MRQLRVGEVVPLQDHEAYCEIQVGRSGNFEGGHASPTENWTACAILRPHVESDSAPHRQRAGSACLAARLKPGTPPTSAEAPTCRFALSEFQTPPRPFEACRRRQVVY